MTRSGLDLDQNEIVTIVAENRNLRIKTFKQTDRLSTGKARAVWLDEIERELRFFKINQRPIGHNAHLNVQL